jgi:hypothetical protein
MTNARRSRRSTIQIPGGTFAGWKSRREDEERRDHGADDAAEHPHMSCVDT